MTGVPMSGNSTAKSHAKYKPRFAEFTCTHSQVSWCFLFLWTVKLTCSKVFRYVRLVTKDVIPREFFGCDKNYKLILKCRLSIFLRSAFQIKTRVCFRCKAIYQRQPIRDYVTALCFAGCQYDRM